MEDSVWSAFLHRERALQLKTRQFVGARGCASSRERARGAAHKPGECDCGMGFSLLRPQIIIAHCVTQTFVRSILDLDADANVIVAGDMNEYAAARAVLRPLSALLYDANDIARVPVAERYTYAYDQHAQEIDHVFVSPAIAARGGDIEHVHTNTWARSVGERASDHDPSVAKVWVCDRETPLEGE